MSFILPLGLGVGVGSIAWIAIPLALRRRSQDASAQYGTVSVLVPVRNNPRGLPVALQSIRQQNYPIQNVWILNDAGSRNVTSNWAYVANMPRWRGKAATVSSMLPMVNTRYVLVVDSDTALTPNYITTLLSQIGNAKAAAGTVLPHPHQGGIYNLSRAAEYAFGQGFFKSQQDKVDAVMVMPGCATLFETSALREIGGLSNRTITEDLDATWCLAERGYSCKYVPKAIAYTYEKENFVSYVQQLKRWMTGFWQNVRLRGVRVFSIPRLRLPIGIALLDGLIITPIWTLFILTQLWNPWTASTLFSIDFLAYAIATCYAGRTLLPLTHILKALPISYAFGWLNRVIWWVSIPLSFLRQRATWR